MNANAVPDAITITVDHSQDVSDIEELTVNGGGSHGGDIDAAKLYEAISAASAAIIASIDAIEKDRQTFADFARSFSMNTYKHLESAFYSSTDLPEAARKNIYRLMCQLKDEVDNLDVVLPTVEWEMEDGLVQK
jgi:hypothetical protein